VQLSTQPYSSYQWYVDDWPIWGANAQSYTALQSGKYIVIASDINGCPGISPTVYVNLYTSLNPAVSGPYMNSCPTSEVELRTDPYYSQYQWRFNGIDIPGATGQTYEASVSGRYGVRVADESGCSGVSVEHPVTVNFCLSSEVSPRGCVFPLRLSKDSRSSTGHFIYFQKIDGSLGYNIYSGTIGMWYSHSGAIGRMCNTATTDLGTGELRASINMHEGNHYYLATAHSIIAEGPSGYASSGAEIPASQNTCAP
jgi:hypothetical protein